MSATQYRSWGQEPYRSTLPLILHNIAMDAARAGGHGDPSLIVTTGLLPDGSVAILLSMDQAVPKWIADAALAWISVRSGDGSTLHNFSSPALQFAAVPSWLTG